MNEFKWSDVKIFIVAPREMSAKRFTEIVKHYLPKGNIVVGISIEPYVVGFENQKQFEMLQREIVQPIINKVALSDSPNKIYVYEYSQTEFVDIASKLNSTHRVLLVNGSWKYAFHNLDVYKILKQNDVPIKFISPFTDENEARDYEKSHSPKLKMPDSGTLLSEKDMFELASRVCLQSYDYSFQVGATLGKKKGDDYEYIASTFNKVIPFQAYALHYGNSRERNLSQPHDANHYDTIHAEMQFLVEAARGDYKLEGATLFIDLLPCPNCARTLSQTDIDGIVYKQDHSDGYGAEILRLCGKKVLQRLKARQYTLY